VTETTHKPIKNTVAQWSNGMMKKEWKPFSPPKNNLIQDSEGNEENGYPVPHSNKSKINDTKEPNDANKNILKEEIDEVIIENFMEMLLDMVNQNIVEAFKKFKNTKSKEYKKTQKQISELIGALNKQQS
jgi:hypothetical protein